MTLAGTRATLVAGAARVAIRTSLVGSGHLENVLAAAATAHALGRRSRRSRSALADFPGVPGRLEPVEAGQDFTVLVDYAHTPDALAASSGRYGRSCRRAHLRLRLRRRSRSRQASAHGGSGRPARRSRHAHLRQPAHGGSRRASSPTPSRGSSAPASRCSPTSRARARGYVVESDRGQAIASALTSRASRRLRRGRRQGARGLSDHRHREASVRRPRDGAPRAGGPRHPRPSRAGRRRRTARS